MPSDVKAGNILVDGEGNVRLADFGVARVVDGSHKRVHARTFVGTPCWMAPEIMNRQTYDASVVASPLPHAQADMWSLGITALEMADGAPPHSEEQPLQALLLIKSSPSPKPKHPEEWSEAFLDFLRRSLDTDVRFRGGGEA